MSEEPIIQPGRDPFSSPTPEPGTPLTWFETFKLIYLYPSVESFEVILRDPTRSNQRAYIWIMAATAIQVVVLGGLFGFYIRLMAAADPGIESELSSTGLGPLVFTICVLLMAPILVVPSTWITVNIINWFATLLGGASSYDRLLYAYLAVLAPSGLLSMLGLIPILGYVVGFALSIYIIALTVMAYQAVYKFSAGRALALYFLPALVATAIMFVLFGCFALIGIASNA